MIGVIFQILLQVKMKKDGRKKKRPGKKEAKNETQVDCETPANEDDFCDESEPSGHLILMRPSPPPFLPGMSMDW